ncbi:unnamed protein product [Arctia plantaginis]|uniref:Uncharacterized protein n=1 Tax=Arctia plantaginis TaxID=874455 RepID=A0A8S0ZAK7_ARCPL|nr:unnamed protein product [Arctia plantaginis]
MAFSGKKFRRVGSENIDALLNAADVGESAKHMLRSKTPTFKFTKVDDNTFNFCLENEGKVMSHDFKLGEATETKRRDGSVVSVTYTLESDNVLTQTIKPANGAQSHFKREFGEKEAKLTITIEGIDVVAVVYYELVE